MNRKEQIIFGILGLLIAACACIAAWLVVPQIQKMFSPPSSPTPAPSSTPSFITLLTSTSTSESSPTLTIEDSPTSTNTPLPTNTPYPTTIPTPIISLPFNDNFSNSSNPAWNFVVGEWFVKNNSLSTLPIANSYEWAFLDDQNLRDYQVKVSVYIPNMYSGNDADARIIFRHDPSRAKQLTMVVDWWGNAYIGILDNIQQRIPTALSDNRAFSVSSANFTMMIQVKGDTFTAFLDGQQVGTVTIKGFDGGGVGLGVTCFYTCPSFSNFSLKPLP